MGESSRQEIEKLLASAKPEDVQRGLQLVKEEISRIGPDESAYLFEMVSTLFYIDPLDRPDLVPVLDEAISLVGGFGAWVIPALVETLDAGDLKSQMAAAQALGRAGADAIGPLMDAYRSSSDPARRSFILYALGKIKSPAIVGAARLAMEAAGSHDVELRDTATRAIGKFAESLSPPDLTEELRRGFVEKLRGNLADPNPGIRAKAVRSLGKLARYGFLTPQEKDSLKSTCLLILGRDEHFEWDRAYVVRREAEEALSYL